MFCLFFASAPVDAHNTGTEHRDNVYGNVLEEVQNMKVMPSFRDINIDTHTEVCGGVPLSTPVYQTAPMRVSDGTIRTIASDMDCGTPATVQPLYSMQYAAPAAPPVRRSPGVPSRAPIGDVLCPLLVCTLIYALHKRYALRRDL